MCRPLTLAEIDMVKGMRQDEAARMCGLRPTAFKKKCRALGIAKWPYRQIRSVMKAQDEAGQAQEFDDAQVGCLD